MFGLYSMFPDECLKEVALRPPPPLQAGRTSLVFHGPDSLSGAIPLLPPLYLNGMHGTRFPFAVLVVGHVVHR